MNLAGKTNLVTGGAGTGVGAGICQAVKQANGRLVINARCNCWGTIPH
jgi:NAD(P)-dependent dehydrogenase (short-subunit alcohol dehydrogenase family)